jgi:uncharacterized membrane protein YiaA
VEHRINSSKPTAAFVGASWAALLLGIATFLIGLWNAPAMLRNEKGYYLALLILGLFSAVSLQKAVRDKSEGIPVTGTYFGIAWMALGAALLLMTVGLWNAATITRAEKGFYAMSFALSLFAAVAVQKNIRDTAGAHDDGKVGIPLRSPARAVPSAND